mmetsp:Transcript_28643/g.39927  ORF Transcript_28643/g.39927 Transcript_28643/m.39927 type:complete len:250 (-) Transcript_28643:992-1741(-)
MKSALLDSIRNPVGFLVVIDKFVFDGGHVDEPAGNCFVDQRCVGSPAERVFVLVLLLQHQPAFVFQLAADDGVRAVLALSFDVLALQLRADLVRIYAIVIHRTHKTLSPLDNVILQTHSVVIFSERGSLMDDACAVAVRDVIIGHDAERPALLTPIFEEVKKRHVFQSQEILSSHLLQNGVRSRICALFLLARVFLLLLCFALLLLFCFLLRFRLGPFCFLLLLLLLFLLGTGATRVFLLHLLLLRTPV